MAQAGTARRQPSRDRQRGRRGRGRILPGGVPDLGHHEDALREPTSASSPPRATRRTHWTPAPHRREQPTDLQHAVGGRVDLTSEALPSESRLKSIQHLSSPRVGARQFWGRLPASFRVGRPRGVPAPTRLHFGHQATSATRPSPLWEARQPGHFGHQAFSPPGSAPPSSHLAEKSPDAPALWQLERGIRGLLKHVGNH